MGGLEDFFKKVHVHPLLFLHHRPQNLGTKKTEMQKKAKMQKKKAENARSISKLMQKRA